MVENAISYNLKRLRISRRLSMKQIAEAAGLSRVAYSNIENGKAEPRVSTLQKIAEVLDVAIQKLVTPVPVLSSVRFRSQKSLRAFEKSKREQIVSDVAIWLKDFNEIEKMLNDKPAHRLQFLSCDQNNSPEEVAKEVRISLDINPKYVISSICVLLESKGIKIYPIKSELNKFFGLSVAESDGGPAIVVNTDDSITIERQIFTIAHELGHLLLHNDSYDASKLEEEEIQEVEADQFASYFLMPQDAFKKRWEENNGMHWIDNILHIKRLFKVSYKTVLVRLVQIGATDKSIWKNFYWSYEQKFGKKLTNHREPDELEKEPVALTKADFSEHRLGCLARKALGKELISFSRAAEILQINIEEMRERANSWKMLKIT